MKFKKLMPLLMVMAVLSCSKEPKENRVEDDLFNQMLSYSFEFSQKIADNQFWRTKSGNEIVADDSVTVIADEPVIVDLSTLSNNVLWYIDIYTKSDDISTWNEKSFFKRLSRDSSITEDEKSALLNGIGVVYSLKNEIRPEGINDKCYDTYITNLKRTLYLAIIGTVTSWHSLTGQLGVWGAAYLKIKFTEQDYVKCLEELKQKDDEGTGTSTDSAIAKLDDGYAVSAPCGDFIIRESFGETIVILPDKRLVIIKAE